MLKVTLGALLVLLAILTAAYFINVKVCEHVGVVTGKEVKYEFISGCYIRTPDGWLPHS